jgi:mono/diheme cytochrome c family protein
MATTGDDAVPGILAAFWPVLAAEVLAAEVLAAEVLGATSPRAEVVERYRSVLATTGDVGRGLAVYRRVCVNCHRHGDEGKAIGPDVRTFAAHAPGLEGTHLSPSNHEGWSGGCKLSVELKEEGLYHGFRRFQEEVTA